ncbi:hypothetical protein GA0115254_118588 [Streptomyces sp. Ncost-T10-10d]|nr:hypothetical protein GA0115254_118588 [Streptomyces sp. Ncost-T10-10d]
MSTVRLKLSDLPARRWLPSVNGSGGATEVPVLGKDP